MEEGDEKLRQLYLEKSEKVWRDSFGVLHESFLKRGQQVEVPPQSEFLKGPEFYLGSKDVSGFDYSKLPKDFEVIEKMFNTNNLTNLETCSSLVYQALQDSEISDPEVLELVEYAF